MSNFTTYKQALALKKIGFDIPCLAKFTVVPEDEIDWFTIPEQVNNNGAKYGGSINYNTKFYWKEGTISAPLKQDVFKWFREKHGLFCQPNRTLDQNGTWYYFSIQTKRVEVVDGSFSYEEAESACIDKLIEIIKNK